MILRPAEGRVAQSLLHNCVEPHEREIEATLFSRALRTLVVTIDFSAFLFSMNAINELINYRVDSLGVDACYCVRQVGLDATRRLEHEASAHSEHVSRQLEIEFRN